MALRALCEADIAFFQEQGYLVVPNVVSQEKLDAVLRCSGRFWGCPPMIRTPGTRPSARARSFLCTSIRRSGTTGSRPDSIRHSPICWAPRAGAIHHHVPGERG